MAEILLFHHAHGRTPGVLTFAAALREAGHTVHVPDLYEGRTFDTLEAGMDHARQVGFEALLARGEAAARDLPHELVYAGFSLGVMPAQRLAQTRPGARGALLISACVPPEDLGGPWPAALPVQIHGMDADPIFAGEGDLDAARALLPRAERAELFLYPGDRHLFADPSLPSHDAPAARLLTERALAFLARLSR
jgi:dienelactone hydrolase